MRHWIYFFLWNGIFRWYDKFLFLILQGNDFLFGLFREFVLAFMGVFRTSCDCDVDFLWWREDRTIKIPKLSRIFVRLLGFFLLDNWFLRCEHLKNFQCLLSNVCRLSTHFIRLLDQGTYWSGNIGNLLTLPFTWFCWLRDKKLCMSWIILQVIYLF